MNKNRTRALSTKYYLVTEPTTSFSPDVYDDYPLGRYGMLKWQIWRALRLIVDTGLHYFGMSRDEAIRLFDVYAWDDTDVARKEVTRYQSGPGQATAYMIGQRALVDIRNEARTRLGSKFNIRDFHFYLLSQGPGPLGYVRQQIDYYVQCTLNRTLPHCKNYLAAEAERELSVRMREFHSGHAEKLEWNTLRELFAPEIHEF